MSELVKLLPKSPTGIEGLDEILYGGIPKGRPTLVCGNAGCGKTLLAMEFLVRGATQFDEPGVFMSFEETEHDLIQNIESLGFDLTDLIARKKIVMDYVSVDLEEILETGEFDLEGLFIRLDHAINSVGAKRVVLDTVETLFSGLPNPLILRTELRRLFHWLKDKEVTAIITGEREMEKLTRHGLEEYISDCVILLDHRVTEQISTRRLRVVKYRGSTHGTNEYPFLILEDGIWVMPITTSYLEHTVSVERVSTGISQLDSMLGGKGYYHGSSIMVAGTSGTGKSCLAAHFAEAACMRGERVIYFSLEESPDQIIRNMRSIGIDLQVQVENGLLQLVSAHSSMYNLEMHLATIYKASEQFQPSIVVIDHISSYYLGDVRIEVKAMLLRLVNFFKTKGITAMLSNLVTDRNQFGHNESISTLVDTYLQLRNLEIDGESKRYLNILKSRGMAHSNRTREFNITDQGIVLLDV